MNKGGAHDGGCLPHACQNTSDRSRTGSPTAHLGFTPALSVGFFFLNTVLQTHTTPLQLQKPPLTSPRCGASARSAVLAAGACGAALWGGAGSSRFPPVPKEPAQRWRRPRAAVPPRRPSAAQAAGRRERVRTRPGRAGSGLGALPPPPTRDGARRTEGSGGLCGWPQHCRPRSAPPRAGERGVKEQSWAWHRKGGGVSLVVALVCHHSTLF